MKKVIFMFIFLILLFGVYGQQRAENRWITGRWIGIVIDGIERINVEFVFNDNGTGRMIISQGSERDIQEFAFSMNNFSIRTFVEENDRFSEWVEIIFYRINDQRMIIKFGGEIINLNKAN